MTKEQCCFFTGHRVIPLSERHKLKKSVEAAIKQLILDKNINVFITGGALGFDTLAANVVLELRKKYDIKLALFLPCKNQTARWNSKDVAEYERILTLSDKHYYISEQYTSDCMLKRNRKMADASSYCISYMRKNHGGTYYSVKYAMNNGLTIIDL